MASDMAIELRSHLQDAMAEGKDVGSVVGGDLQSFAQEWASAHGAGTPAVGTGIDPEPKTANLWLWLGSLGIVGLVAGIALFSTNDTAMDQATWAAVWIIAAGLLAAGELITAGFFLLPFAAGAGAAGILALAEVGVTEQFIIFVVVSVAFLWLLQRFARKDMHGELITVGAARYIGAHAMVTGPIDRRAGEGSVRMATEDWRATTDSNAVIPVGAEVTVVEVRGTRLVVKKIEN